MPGMSHATRRPRKTLEDYLALPDDVRAELIDGELYVTPSPGTPHQRGPAVRMHGPAFDRPLSETHFDLRRRCLGQIEVVPGIEPLVLRLPVPGTLACHVVDRTGAHVARQNVHVTSLDVPEGDGYHLGYRPTTDIAGRYLVEVRCPTASNEILASEKVVVPPDGEVEACLVIDRH